MSNKVHQEREHFFGAAKVIAGLTLLSRVLGMVRDMAITSLGASRATAAFLVAFQVPNLFRRLFGEGALSGAFVPVFTDTAERDGWDAARRLFANAFGLMSVLLIVLCVLVYAGLLAWHLLWPGAWDRQLLVRLISVTLPFMITICLLALGSAALNCRGRFAYPAFAPILLNIFIITAAWFVAPAVTANLETRLTLIAASVTIAGVVQLIGILWLLRGHDFSIRPKLRPVEPGIRPMAKLMLPMMIGLGFLQVSPFFDMILIWVFTATGHSPTITLFGTELAKPLSEAAQMRVYAAQRMYQFPMGVLAISLGVAVFPLFSRYSARGDTANLRESVNRALRLTMMEGLAAGTGLFVLAEPIVQLIFVRGRFTVADAVGSAFVLKMYALGMWAYCSYQIFSRAFFALKQPRTPLKVSCVLVVVNVLAAAVLIWWPPLGAGAFGVATAATAGINAMILGVLLRRRIGRIGGRALAVSVLRSLVACTAMAGAVYLLRWLLAGQPNWLIVVVCIAAGGSVFVLAAWAMRAPELGELFGALRRKTPADATTEDRIIE